MRRFATKAMDSVRAGAAFGPAVLLSVLLGLAAAPVTAQDTTITPNYKDADIRQVIEAVGEVTGRNFVLDPRVKAQVTMLSAAPMSPEAFYEAFLSILQVYGFVAVPSGDVVKILPDANARQVPGAELEPGGGQRPDDIVTRVISMRTVGAAQLVPILRPLIPQYGHLAAHPPSNLLIISDRAANVDRMLRIVARLDQAADQDYEVIRLEHATANEIVRIVSSLTQAAAQAEGGGPTRVTVVADERTATGASASSAHSSASAPDNSAASAGGTGAAVMRCCSCSESRVMPARSSAASFPTSVRSGCWRSSS